MQRLSIVRYIYTSLIASLVAMVAIAAVPTSMSYQGLLKDAASDPVPDGGHDVTFRIYNEADSLLWEESHDVTTTGGHFSVELGSNGSPLSADVFGHAECWLGITVGTDPELAPRTWLVTVPYSFRTGTVDGATGGTLESDLSIVGPSSTSFFRTDETGDAAVELPPSAIQSGEMFNEPGVAAYSGAYYLYLDDSTHTVICSLSIDCPDAGFVLALFNGRLGTTPTHTFGTPSYATLGISDAATYLPGNQDLDFHVDSTLPDGRYYTPFGLSSMFTVPSGGTYTYYVLGFEYSGSITVADLQFNLVYFPTAYGSVDLPPPTKGTKEEAGPHIIE